MEKNSSTINKLYDSIWERKQGAGWCATLPFQNQTTIKSKTGSKTQERSIWDLQLWQRPTEWEPRHTSVPECGAGFYLGDASEASLSWGTPPSWDKQREVAFEPWTEAQEQPQGRGWGVSLRICRLPSEIDTALHVQRLPGLGIALCGLGRHPQPSPTADPFETEGDTFRERPWRRCQHQTGLASEVYLCLCS